MADAIAQHRVFYRKHHFHAFIKITRHPICAGKVNRILTPVGEIKDAAVFEKTSDNAAYALVADAPNSGSKRRHAAYDQVDRQRPATRDKTQR